MTENPKNWVQYAKCNQIFLLDESDLVHCANQEEIRVANIKKVHGLFFPSQGDSTSADIAIGICNTCPVQGECLKYSMDLNDKLGIWGGTSGRTRRRLSRMRKIVATSQTFQVTQEDFDEDTLDE